MAKYIDRKKLPQFQLYNFCAGKENGWDIGQGNGMHIRTTAKEFASAERIKE